MGIACVRDQGEQVLPGSLCEEQFPGDGRVTLLKEVEEPFEDLWLAVGRSPAEGSRPEVVLAENQHEECVFPYTGQDSFQAEDLSAAMVHGHHVSGGFRSGLFR